MDTNDFSNSSLPGDGWVVFSPAHALTEQEIVAKLKAAGYSQIGEIRSTAEGTVVNAVKDGKEVHLLVDGTGQMKER